jgi:hypothetical protein
MRPFHPTRTTHVFGLRGGISVISGLSAVAGQTLPGFLTACTLSQLGG